MIPPNAYKTELTIRPSSRSFNQSMFHSSVVNTTKAMPPVPNNKVVKSKKFHVGRYKKRQHRRREFASSKYNTDNRLQRTSLYSSPSTLSTLGSDINWLKKWNGYKSAKEPSQSLSEQKAKSETTTEKKSKSWAEWKEKGNVEIEIKTCRSPAIKFDTPLYELQSPKDIPFFDLSSNEENWREFKTLKGKCNNDIITRIPLVKNLVPSCHDATVNDIYNLNGSIQCGVCGIRFSLEERKKEYAQHLDFHYVNKMNSKNAWNTCRWYPTLESIKKNDSNILTSDLNSPNPNKALTNEKQYLGNWEAPSRHCELCLEQFEQEYLDGDNEGWHFVNAIVTKDGKSTVHPGCLS
nr:uncharacterized protein LOC121126372 [Lepeophtheirus salmonis]